MKKLICLVLIIAFLSGFQCALAADSASKNTSPTTGEYLKKTAKELAKETTKDIVKKKVQEQAEKKAPELISYAYKKYPVIAKFTGNKDFSALMKDYGRYSDAYGKLSTLNALLIKVAEGDTLGAAYDATKETFTAFFPYSKYIFQFAEAWNKMLTLVEGAVTENNLDFIRGEFMKQVLPKCKEQCPLSEEQNFARLMGERLDEGGDYGLVVWYCEEGGAGSTKCGSICVSTRKSFGVSGCEDDAVMHFVRRDQKIKQAVAVHHQLLRAIEDVGDMQKALEKTRDYVRKNLLLFEQEQEKIITEQENLKQEQQKAAREKVDMAKSPEKCDESCAKQYRKAWAKTKALVQEIEEKRKLISLKERNLEKEMWAKNNELKFSDPGEIRFDPGSPEIDEEVVDYNGRQAERLAALILNAEKWLQSQQMQIRIYDERIAGLQSLSGLYAQRKNLETQYGTGDYYRSSEQYTANYPLILDNEIKGVELKKQALLDEIALVQNNLSQYKTIQNKYQSAFDEGARKAKELLEKEIEPAFKEYEEASIEYENTENEIRTYEQEKLVQINNVLGKIRGAKSQAELDAIPSQADRDMAEYGALRQKQWQLAGKIDEKKQKIESASRSKRIRGSATTLGYKGKSVSSRTVRADMSGARFSLSQYLKYIAEANRYVVTASAEEYNKALQALPDEAKFIIMPENDLKKIISEIYSSVGAAGRSIKYRAETMAKLKDFSGAYSAYQADLGSNVKFGDWKIDAVLSEEARGALNKLASFPDTHLRPLEQKRTLKINEQVAYSGPRIGRGAKPVHGSVRLTDADIRDGAIPIKITATGWGIGRAIVKVTIEGKILPLEIKSSTAGDKPEAVYTAMIPVKSRGETKVSYTIGNVTHSLTLQPPVNSMATQNEVREIKGFYDKFKHAYEGKNDSQVAAMISDDWQAGDGSTISDLQVNLRRTFKVFDEIRYNIQNLSVTPGTDGRYNVSYDVTITSRIYKRNLKHEEKSSIQEEVTIDHSGKPKISKTLGGRFWYVQ